jgi:hypothetical protein
MVSGLVAIKIALRVIEAYFAGRKPDPFDVAELHRRMPNHTDLRSDELACKIIWEESSMR